MTRHTRYSSVHLFSHCAVSRFMAQGVSHHASTRAWRGVRGFVSQNIRTARKYSGVRFNESFNWSQRTERGEEVEGNTEDS